MTPAEIKEYWRNQAISFGTSHDASWTDTHMIDLEYRTILNEITGRRILDVGCANGYTTLKIANALVCAEQIKGIDFIPEMIDAANRALEKQSKDVKKHTMFAVGDIRKLKESGNSYDTVICIRVLINLGCWGEQEKAIDECMRVVKRGGRLIISEATIQGWKRLNALRKETGLSKIPIPAFNTYLDENKIMKHRRAVLCRNFSSTYFIGTRILKSFYCGKNAKNPNMEWNRLFSLLPSFGDYGTQKLFIFEKD